MRALTIVLLACQLAPGDPCVGDQEPNDTPATATHAGGLGVPTGGFPPFAGALDVCGRIDRAGDVDWFDTWLGFDFPPSNWGLDLTVSAEAPVELLVWQDQPLGNRSVVLHEIVQGTQLFPDVNVDHFPGLGEGYVHLVVRGIAGPTAYRISNLPSGSDASLRLRPGPAQGRGASSIIRSSTRELWVSGTSRPERHATRWPSGTSVGSSKVLRASR